MKIKKLKIQKILYHKLIGCFLKKGERKKVQRVVLEAFTQLSLMFKKRISYILTKLFLNLNTFIELRQIRMRMKTFKVPFSIRLNRRLFLAMRWITKAIIKNKKVYGLKNKIVSELALIYEKKPTSRALLYKKINDKQARKNRSNFHYRW